jgi:tryptophan halogenase
VTHADAEARGRADRLRSIVIVGGGTAGWMTAALLARRLAPLGVALTLVESSAIGTIGVGEATTPAIRDYFEAAGLDEAAVMRATEGTAKLGIAFEGWAGEGSRFFHPFGLYGSASGGTAFHHYWLMRRAAGDATPLDRYSLASRLAEAGAMMTPLRPAPDFAFFDWALHFDASLYAQHLGEVAMARGVRRVDAHICGAQRDPATGRIIAVQTVEQGAITGDLFVDCTGFRSLLLGVALDEPFVDWSELLPVDRAVAIPCAASHESVALAPFTRSIARAAGWQWRIPLRHRVGNGYVYCSRHLSDDEAVATLDRTLEGAALAEPNLLRFTAGHRRCFWSSNCVAIGLSAGFLEPLESTSITLIHSAIERLIDLLPDRGMDPALAAEYNRITAIEYERIRDFLVLHYHGNARTEPFWRERRAARLPEPLAHKIRMFRSRGELVRYDWETFADPSWLSLFAGLDMLPERWDPRAEILSAAQIDGAFGRMRADIDRLAAGAMPHRAWLER